MLLLLLLLMLSEIERENTTEKVVIFVSLLLRTGQLFRCCCCCCCCCCCSFVLGRYLRRIGDGRSFWYRAAYRHRPVACAQLDDALLRPVLFFASKSPRFLFVDRISPSLHSIVLTPTKLSWLDFFLPSWTLLNRVWPNGDHLSWVLSMFT